MMFWKSEEFSVITSQDTVAVMVN